MFTTDFLFMLLHVTGLALGLGSATVKTVLLLRCNTNHDLVGDYVKIVKPLTRILILGLILMTLSGIGWLVTGYPFTRMLMIKVILVALVWVAGPIIDNVTEPRFIKHAPKPGQEASSDFISIKKKHLMLEIMATGLMYAAMVLGIMV